MPNAIDERPLLERLKARTTKYRGIPPSPTTPLSFDIALHKQSIEEIERLSAELADARQRLDQKCTSFAATSDEGDT